MPPPLTPPYMARGGVVISMIWPPIPEYVRDWSENFFERCWDYLWWSYEIWRAGARSAQISGARQNIDVFWSQYLTVLRVFLIFCVLFPHETDKMKIFCKGKPFWSRVLSRWYLYSWRAPIRHIFWLLKYQKFPKFGPFLAKILISVCLMGAECRPKKKSWMNICAI